MEQIEKEKNFWELIKILNENKLLNNIIIVGSWAEILYSKIDHKYDNLMVTNDLDLLYSNINYSLENKINLKEILKEKQYDINIDRLNNVIRFNKGDFEIEFLSHLKGSGKNDTNYLKAIGINSEALRHLDVLDKYSFTNTISGFKLRLPEPAAYIIHKMIINHNRKQDKKEKDIISIISLLSIIENDEKQINKFNEIYNDLNNTSKKSIKYLLDFVKENNINLTHILKVNSKNEIYNKNFKNVNEEITNVIKNVNIKKNDYER